MSAALEASLTAESRPSAVPDALRRRCTKCRGKGVGDFGMYERGKRCYNCDAGWVFTPSAWARVLQLRFMRDAERLAEKGTALAAERWEDEALRQDKLRQMREAVRETRARANAAWAVWRRRPTTLRQVRVAVFGVDDTGYYAK